MGYFSDFLGIGEATQNVGKVWGGSNAEFAALRRELLPFLNNVLQMVGRIEKPVLDLPDTLHRAVVFESKLEKEEVEKSKKALDEINIQMIQIQNGQPYINHSKPITILLDLIEKIQRTPITSTGHQFSSEDQEKLSKLKDLLNELNKGRLKKATFTKEKKEQFREGKEFLSRLLTLSILSFLEERIFKSPVMDIQKLQQGFQVLLQKKEETEVSQYIPKEEMFTLFESLIVLDRKEKDNRLFPLLKSFFEKVLKVEAQVKSIDFKENASKATMKGEEEVFLQAKKAFEWVKDEHLKLENLKERLAHANREIEQESKQITELQLEIPQLKLEKEQLDKDQKEYEESKVENKSKEFPQEARWKELDGLISKETQKLKKKQTTNADEKKKQTESLKKFVEILWSTYNQFASTLDKGCKTDSDKARFKMFKEDMLQLLGLNSETPNAYEVLGKFEALKEHFIQHFEQIDQLHGKLDKLIQNLEGIKSSKEIKTHGELLNYYTIILELKELGKQSFISDELGKALIQIKEVLENNLETDQCYLLFEKNDGASLMEYVQELQKEFVDPNLGIFFQFKQEIDRVLSLVSGTSRNTQQEEIYRELKSVLDVFPILKKGNYSEEDSRVVKKAKIDLENLLNKHFNIKKLEHKHLSTLLAVLKQEEHPLKIREDQDIDAAKKALEAVVSRYETSIEKEVRKYLEIVSSQAMTMVGVLESRVHDLVMQDAKEEFQSVEKTLDMICGFKEGEIHYLTPEQQILFESFEGNIGATGRIDSTYDANYGAIMIDFNASYTAATKTIKLNPGQLVIFKGHQKLVKSRIERHFGLVPRIGRAAERTITEKLEHLQAPPPKAFEDQWQVLIDALTKTQTPATLQTLNTYLTQIETKDLAITATQVIAIKKLWGETYQRGKISNVLKLNDLITEMGKVASQNAGSLYFLEKKGEILTKNLAKLAENLTADALSRITWRLIGLSSFFALLAIMTVFVGRMAWHAADTIMLTRTLSTKA